MAKLGVEVDTFKGDLGEKGYVESSLSDDGKPVVKIMLNENADITTTPIHELMHMVFAVMKTDNYDAFERAMNIMMRSDVGKQMLQEIRESAEYGNLIDLDQKEEVMCRIFEALVENNNFEFFSKEEVDNLEQALAQAQTQEEIDELQKRIDETKSKLLFGIQDLINPYIEKTFGIQAPEMLISFLSDTIADLPSYDSTLFMKAKRSSTGFLDRKTDVVRSNHIVNYLAELVQDKKLKQVEC